MNETLKNDLMLESFRWYGPDDPVTLRDIRQTGAEGIYTALHHIPYGEAWPLDEIRQRKALLEAEAMRWVAVEPIPISEDIKTRTDKCDQHIENYCESVRNLGRAGIEVVLNCFMPALEWMRTELAYVLEDGSECLYYDPSHFAAFEIYLLKRPGAEQDFTQQQLEDGGRFFHGMNSGEQEAFSRRLCGMFPGIELQLTLDQLRERLRPYQEIDAAQLKANLKYFLEAVVPVAEESGVRLAMHPDDPPFPILGLPRVVSTESDYSEMLEMVESPANGICFCTGSLGSRDDNDLLGMVDRLGSRIHAVHLRNVQRLPSGAFYEADHLAGSVDMPAVVKALLNEQKKRRENGRSDCRLTFRPDHGHAMLDDLNKPPLPNPGYTCLGRSRGLAELRGLQMGLVSA